MPSNLTRFYARLLRAAGRDISFSAWRNLAQSSVLGPVCRRLGPDRLPFGPVRVLLTVTRACNKRCAFCSYRDELRSPSSPEVAMDLEVFARLLETRRVREALALHLYGGEPLLHDDLPQMIGMARGRGHLVTVHTNGLLLAEKAPGWKEARPHVLSISYDQASEDALAAGLAEIPTEIVVKLSLVISKKRLEQMRAFFECARSNRVTFVEVANLQPSRDSDDEPVMAEDDAYRALRSECEREHGRDHVIFWPPVASRATRPETARCEMMWTTLFLDVDGGVSPCCTLPLSSCEGTVLGDDDLWNGPRLRSARRGLRTGQPPSFCASCCYLHYNELP